jgi:hypothetical protein
VHSIFVPPACPVSVAAQSGSLLNPIESLLEAAKRCISARKMTIDHCIQDHFYKENCNG